MYFYGNGWKPWHALHGREWNVCESKTMHIYDSVAQEPRINLIYTTKIHCELLILKNLNTAPFTVAVLRTCKNIAALYQ